jgi:hypothetical protein
MSAFNCPAKTALTDSELNQTFGNGTVVGLLPSTPNGSSDREENGMLKDSAVNSIVSNLKGQGVIPTATATNAEAFVKKQSELLKNIQAEYCFYDARYKYSLEKLLQSIQQGYVANTGDTQAAIQKYLASTQSLNQRLNDFVQIINGVTNDMMASSSNIEGEIQAFNKQINEQKKKLDAQNRILMSDQAAVKLNKEMVKFTEQKAKYSDNLLSVYSVLNIVALGLLVYVYRSSN